MGRVTVQVGNREVAVDTDPLRGGGSNFRTHVLAEPRDGLVVLRPSLGFRLFAVAFLVMGCIPLAIAGVMASAHGRDAGVWVLCGFGGAFLLAGLVILLAPRRHAFDTEAGTWAIRGLAGRSSRPLTDVLAVQLIPGGWHTTRSGGTHARTTTYFTYQLNVVLDSEPVTRQTLLDYTDWDSIWQTGHRLAEALGVPFLDSASQAADES